MPLIYQTSKIDSFYHHFVISHLSSLVNVLCPYLCAEHLAVSSWGAERSPGGRGGQPEAPRQPQAPAAGRRWDDCSCRVEELCREMEERRNATGPSLSSIFVSFLIAAAGHTTFRREYTLSISNSDVSS